MLERWIFREVERIEHHISKPTAVCISNLLSFFVANPHIKESFVKYTRIEGPHSN
ncbi:hypothetical protein LG329_16860 [Virgibacillus necropolis]